MSQGRVLPGGVSSDIEVVETPDGPIVVKQALPRLRVAASWWSDPARAHTEVRALRVAADLLGPTQVPRVLWEDAAQHRFGMSLIDPCLRNWKEALLEGRVDPRTATAAGALLGRLHAGSAGRPDLAGAFADRTAFQELRIVPFFDHVADKWPDLAGPIGAVAAAMAQQRRALVHGDYSPKNILAAGGRIVVVDFEVAHWGDPAFDVSFCLSHLILKAWRRGADGAALRAAAGDFLASYTEVAGMEQAGGAVDGPHLARLLGCLLLARIDGDSPVDYLADLDPDAVRNHARALLTDPPARLAGSAFLTRSS